MILRLYGGKQNTQNLRGVIHAVMEVATLRKGGRNTEERDVTLHIKAEKELLDEGSFNSKLAKVQSHIDACKGTDGISYSCWESVVEVEIKLQAPAARRIKSTSEAERQPGGEDAADASDDDGVHGLVTLTRALVQMPIESVGSDTNLNLKVVGTDSQVGRGYGRIEDSGSGRTSTQGDQVVSELDMILEPVHPGCI